MPIFGAMPLLTRFLMLLPPKRQPTKRGVVLIFLLALVCGLPGWLSAQQLYYVYLREKAPAGPEIAAEFHPTALARRERCGLAFPAWEDLPLRTADIAAVAAEVDSVRYALRWFNALTVAATPAQVRALERLACVRSVTPMATWEASVAEVALPPLPADTARQHQLHRLVQDMLHLDALRAAGLTGKGVRIAVFDAGFSGADEHPGLRHIWDNQHMVLAHDFYGGKGEAVYYGSGHGTGVLGCIAGMGAYGPIGAATEATFLLARTEHNNKEKPIEEDHWLAAAEWADRNGADVISSSLGYAQKRYTPAMMDGRQAPVSRAAAMAVRKGIVVVNAAGNEGSGDFKIIAAPADADSVLSIGAVFPQVAVRMPFSSTGPNARGVLKPDLCAPGYVLSTHKGGGYKEMPGTSFACPLVAGMVACLIQKHPAWTGFQVRDSLLHCGHFQPYFDFELGRGVLDARRMVGRVDSVAPTFALASRNDSLFVLPDPKVFQTARNKGAEARPLYVAAVDADGILRAYLTVRLSSPQSAMYLQPSFLKRGRLRIWFEGYYWEQPQE
jgi:serine protease AprX